MAQAKRTVKFEMQLEAVAQKWAALSRYKNKEQFCYFCFNTENIILQWILNIVCFILKTATSYLKIIQPDYISFSVKVVSLRYMSWGQTFSK